MDVKSQDSSDNKAIDTLVENWIAAHNSGDAEALVDLYAADADFIGIDGQVISGREAVVGMYAEVFRHLPGNKAQVSVNFRRFVTPDVVVEDASWEVIGILPEGAPSKGISTTVFKKEDGRWCIQCARSMVPVTRTAMTG